MKRVMITFNDNYLQHCSMKRIAYIPVLILILIGCGSKVEEKEKKEQFSKESAIKSLDLEQAKKLIHLPLQCIDQEYPNKLNQVIASEGDLRSPNELHPAFYGCFDWHSAVHGHWSLVRLIRSFPELDTNDRIADQLLAHLTKENIAGEVAYFENETNKGFERMYGWAWLLKLSAELKMWEHPKAKAMEDNLKPLSDLITDNIKTFLPKLNYPIRVGTHTNTAFALTMAFDYGMLYDDKELINVIKTRAKYYYAEDENCPLTWEPSGYDFLSPCLEEADLMRRVLSKEEFEVWMAKFLPDLKGSEYTLNPGIVSDRADGHLVHLDGLNFSRAWCLFGIAKTLPQYGHLNVIADEHIKHSLDNLVGDGYEGGHWLASFALLSLTNDK